MEYFEYMADMYEVTLDTFLSEIVGTGCEAGIVIDELDPETGYVVYVYGITENGELASEIVREAVTTETPYESDITFEFTVEEYEAATTAAKMSSTPSPSVKIGSNRHEQQQTLSTSQIEAKGMTNLGFVTPCL